jgi:aspartyl-tRNA(Asn)/glutamyl-tRNA(Gln) amidotransferase subunit C
MSLDKAAVARIAHLARIKVQDDELDNLAGDLNRILSFVEQLNEVDTKDVPPMTSVAAQKLRRRKDAVTDGGYADAVLSNGPETAEGFYVVPKVVE